MTDVRKIALEDFFKKPEKVMVKMWLLDIKILKALIINFDGAPVGLDSLGVVISENSKTIEEVYEPYLIKEGYVQRTSRGRIALDKTYKYLGLNNPNNNQT